MPRLPQRLQIRTGDDDGQIGRRAGHRLGDVVDDRLREAEEAARDLAAQPRRQLLDRSAFRFPRWPRVVRRQGDEELVAIRSVRIRPVVVAAGLRRDLLHLGRLLARARESALASSRGLRRARCRPESSRESRARLRRAAAGTRSRASAAMPNAASTTAAAPATTRHGRSIVGLRADARTARCSQVTHRVLPRLRRVPEQVRREHRDQRQRQQHRAERARNRP